MGKNENWSKQVEVLTETFGELRRTYANETEVAQGQVVAALLVSSFVVLPRSLEFVDSSSHLNIFICAGLALGSGGVSFQETIFVGSIFPKLFQTIPKMKRELALLRAELKRAHDELALTAEQFSRFGAERLQLKAQIAAVSGFTHLKHDMETKCRRLEGMVAEKTKLAESQQTLLNQLAERYRNLKAGQQEEFSKLEMEKTRLAKIVRHVVEVEGGGKRYDFRGAYLSDAMDGVDVRLGEKFAEYNARRGEGGVYTKPDPDPRSHTRSRHARLLSDQKDHHLTTDSTSPQKLSPFQCLSASKYSEDFVGIPLVVLCGLLVRVSASSCFRC